MNPAGASANAEPLTDKPSIEWRWAVRVGLVIAATGLACYIAQQVLTGGAYTMDCQPPSAFWSMFERCQQEMEHLRPVGLIAAAVGTVTSIVTRPLARSAELPAVSRTLRVGMVVGFVIGAVAFAASLPGVLGPGPERGALTVLLIGVIVMAGCAIPPVPATIRPFVSPVATFCVLLALIFLTGLYTRWFHLFG